MFGPDPDIVRDSSVDLMHEAPSHQKAYAEQDQIIACEPIGIGVQNTYAGHGLVGVGRASQQADE